MIIDELLRDIAIDGGKELFLTAVERFRTNFKSKDEWKKLFVDTGEFFIEHENNAEPLFDDLALVLSKTNMEKLAREFEKDSGYELKERLLNSLIRLMKEYEIPRDVAYSYSYRILSVIYDYSLDKTNDLYWFLMPKARKYLYFKNRAYDSLKQMLELGQIILALHSLQCAHRDIKPDNILFYDNRIHLSDYGLIWDADVPLAITDSGDHLGPFIIRPPEFEKGAYRVEDFKMFRASDVYLFAKTLWIVISKIDHGFFGEYSRTDTSKCLNRDDLKLGITIEPLHRLMEGATKDNYLERITIEECLNHIRIQMQIKEGILPQKELNKLAFSERINAAKKAVRPNELIYTEIVSALTVIAEFSNVADVVVNNSIHPIHLGRLQSVKLFNESVIKLDVRDVTGKKEYYISVEHVKINSEGLCTCLIKKEAAVADLSVKRITEINEFELLTVKKAILDTDITLSFECPNP